MIRPTRSVVLNAVASFAALIVLAVAFGLAFVGVFFTALLLIRDFFVTAIFLLPGMSLDSFRPAAQDRPGCLRNLTSRSSSRKFISEVHATDLHCGPQGVHCSCELG